MEAEAKMQKMKSQEKFFKMNRFVNRKSILFVLLALTLVIAFAGGAMLRGESTRAQAKGSHAASPKAVGSNPVCSNFTPDSAPLSSGGLMYCYGSQANGAVAHSTASSKFGSNVNAANPQEDVTPAGVRVYGQSETSIAGVGPYVVEAWNDSTGFFSPCPSPMFKEELTGYGFSANGGKSFVDEGGLPNNCTTGFKLFGDPSVETWQTGGTSYFYISSLYIQGPRSDIALNACKATGTGSSATLTCSMPIIIATGGPGDFLDKEFLSIDPARGRLYASFTRFGSAGNSANGQIELAVCDIATNPATPACFPGPLPAPYFVVAPATTCVNQGSYPAVDVATGNVYVGYEFNWISNFATPSCQTVPTQNSVAYVPFTCLTLTPVSPCTTTPLTNGVNIVSMDRANIPGYNRNSTANGRPNDFPRIAVSDKYGTVSIVWNDARVHMLGDILLQSFNLVSLTLAQASPVRVNTLANGGLHFLPALRQADEHGNINVSFFQRNVPATDSTDVYAALSVNPRTTSTPKSNYRVTTAPSPWLDTSSTIIPNFGDYTDNYIMATPITPYVNDTLYVAWSDGRLGVPQPFEANADTDFS